MYKTHSFVHIPNKKHTPEIVITAKTGGMVYFFPASGVVMIFFSRAAISSGVSRNPL